MSSSTPTCTRTTTTWVRSRSCTRWRTPVHAKSSPSAATRGARATRPSPSARSSTPTTDVPTSPSAVRGRADVRGRAMRGTACRRSIRTSSATPSRRTRRRRSTSTALRSPLRPTRASFSARWASSTTSPTCCGPTSRSSHARWRGGSAWRATIRRARSITRSTTRRRAPMRSRTGRRTCRSPSSIFRSGGTAMRGAPSRNSPTRRIPSAMRFATA